MKEVVLELGFESFQNKPDEEWRSAFQAEGTACAKAGRCEVECCAQGHASSSTKQARGE